jgi:hypothetical protein
MSAITILDPQVVAALSKLSEVTVVRDQNGTAIGTFTPASASNLRDLFDREEIQRRKERARNEGTRPFSEVIEKLRSLEAGSS